MKSIHPPVSLVAERAVRYLRGHDKPVPSTELARAVLASQVSREATAKQVLDEAFGRDPRLVYDGKGWVSVVPEHEGPVVVVPPREETDRVLILVQGSRPAPRRPFHLTSISAIRMRGDLVIAACGGDLSPGPSGDELRRSVLETIEGAIPVLHDPPGAIAAIERWVDEPIETAISLRKLGQARLQIGAAHDLEQLCGRLGLGWRESDDPLEMVESLEACLAALRRPRETLEDLRASSLGGAPPLDWSRFQFDRGFLRGLPRAPGTYSFFDQAGQLLYVGKSKNLHRRIGSYFREGAGHPARVQTLLSSLCRIEVEPVGSDLEAMLEEAAKIRRQEPAHNIHRRHRVRDESAKRLRSILILEPAAPPWVLRAYLLRDGRLLEKVGVGRRGGGLRRIERILEDHYFSFENRPTSGTGPEVDVEIVARWLAGNRDRAVAFDPTDLRSAREVTDRLRWFLDRGELHDPDGAPILVR